MGIKVIRLEFNGQEGTINEDEAFVASEAIEEHIPLFDLVEMMGDPAKIKTVKLSRAYAAVLQVAGISADPKDVRAAITQAFKGGKDGVAQGAEFMVAIKSVCTPLYQILTDGAATDASAQAEDDGSGNP